MALAVCGFWMIKRECEEGKRGEQVAVAAVAVGGRRLQGEAGRSGRRVQVCQLCGGRGCLCPIIGGQRRLESCGYQGLQAPDSGYHLEEFCHILKSPLLIYFSLLFIFILFHYLV